MAETLPPHPPPLPPPPMARTVNIGTVLKAARALSDGVLRHQPNGVLQALAHDLSWQLEVLALQPPKRRLPDWPVIVMGALGLVVAIGTILALLL